MDSGSPSTTTTAAADAANPASASDMFRPPINRSMRVLDRPFFHKTIPLAAAQILDPRRTEHLRRALKDDLLKRAKLMSIHHLILASDKGLARAKGMLLRPEVKPNDRSTWSEALIRLEAEKDVNVVPFALELDYTFWDHHEIMSAILPESLLEDLPSGFSVVGHVAHLNLREEYLPYKELIATVLLDKTLGLRTVINKIDDVGAMNAYRTFQYELLAGDPDLNVEIAEEGCIFRFDYSKVYWNSRLNTEHGRLVEKFKPGEAVCDVMAGVGPFAIPAGKKRCWVFANDLNPDSYGSLKEAVKTNKVDRFVLPFNQDGHAFIRSATDQLLAQDVTVDVTPPQSRSNRHLGPVPPGQRKQLTRPKVFAHYVLNLPASALTFLPAFRGVYSGKADLFYPNTETQLPMIHVYCFNLKSDDTEAVELDIAEEISRQIGFSMRPGPYPEAEDSTVSIWDVRSVAPKKRMFCGSFRLPAEVAFAEDSEVP